MAASAGDETSDMNPGCRDFALFQEMLKKWRLMDDRIVSALNCSVLTDSFKQHDKPEAACKKFYDELREVHKNRDKMIKTCIKDISSRVTHLQELKENPGIIANGSQEDRKIISGLRKEQKMLRQAQQELSVEEIIQDRSLKAYYERCRLLYTPPNLDPST